MKPKHLFIFIAVLLFGLMIEGLKGLRGLSTDKSDRIASFSLKGFDVKPFRVSDKDMEENRNEIQKQGGRSRGGFRLSSAPQLQENYDFSEGHNVAKEVAEHAKPTDKKAKAKKKKNARGKGKKEDKPGDDTSKLYPESEKARVRDSQISATQQFEQQFIPAVKKDNTLPISYEDWAKLILGRPQPANVAKLVDYFSSNMVSAEIFYGILGALAQEEDPEQRLLAIFAAGNVPNPRSFVFLVDILKGEGQGSLVAAKANEQIVAYKTLSSVVHLQSVLSQQISDPNIVQIAINIVDQSTQSYLENRKPADESARDNTSESARGNTNETTPDKTAQLQAQAKNAYSGFPPILKEIIKVYADQSDIVAPAQRALTRLENPTNPTVVVAQVNG